MIQNQGYVTLIWVEGSDSGLVGEFDSESEIRQAGYVARWAEDWEVR